MISPAEFTCNLVDDPFLKLIVPVDAVSMNKSVFVCLMKELPVVPTLSDNKIVGKSFSMTNPDPLPAKLAIVAVGVAFPKPMSFDELMVAATDELLSAIELFPTAPLAVNFATLFVVPLPVTLLNAATESMPFCLHALVLNATVSALTDPVVVIVVNDMPVPAETDVTDPDPPAGMAAFLMTPSASAYNMFIPVAVLSIVRTLTRPFTSRGWVGDGVEMPTSLVVA